MRSTLARTAPTASPRCAAGTCRSGARGSRFEFIGKGGKAHVVDVHDRRVAVIVRRCQDLPTHELFQYVDEAGRRQTVGSADVNAYLRDAGGSDFTAKDFRTWGGTLIAMLTLSGAAAEPRTKKRLREAVASVAERLGNTPTICRTCYIHPHVMDGYLDGGLGAVDIKTGGAPARGGARGGERLRAEERTLLRFLERFPGRYRAVPSSQLK